MTFKRHIDRLPIIPADAKVHNATCQFCIVGYGPLIAYSNLTNEDCPFRQHCSRGYQLTRGRSRAGGAKSCPKKQNRLAGLSRLCDYSRYKTGCSYE